MRDIQRLLDGTDTNDFERWLLRSAASERPAAASVAAMRSGLGLSVVAAMRVSSLSSLKVTLLAVSVGAFLGLHGTEQTASPVLNASVVMVDTAAPDGNSNAAVKSDEQAPLPELTAPPIARPEPVAQQVASSKVTRGKDRGASAERGRPSSGPDLREEIRLLDSARNAIQSHQAEGALESLNTYSTRFPSGAFRQEASVLRIQAVALRGETARASSMAKQFVENNPNSPYVGKASRIAKSPGAAGAPQ